MRQDSTHTTIDHHTIRDRAEQRAGYPVHVLGSEGEADAIRVHRPPLTRQRCRATRTHHVGRVLRRVRRAQALLRLPQSGPPPADSAT